MNTHRVKRTFPSSQPVKIGGLIDASGWRNRALLERQGYIEPIEQTFEAVKETGSATDTQAAAEAAAVETVEVQELLTATETPTATVTELLNIVAPAEDRLPEVVEIPAVIAPVESPAVTVPAAAKKTSTAKKSTSKTKK